MKQITCLLFLCWVALQSTAQNLPLPPEHVFNMYGTYEKGLLTLKPAETASFPDQYYRYIRLTQSGDYYYYNTNDSLFIYKAMLQTTSLKELKHYYLKLLYRVITDTPRRLVVSNNKYFLECDQRSASISVSYRKLDQTQCYQ